MTDPYVQNFSFHLVRERRIERLAARLERAETDKERRILTKEIQIQEAYLHHEANEIQAS